MIENIIATYKRLLSAPKSHKVRYLYANFQIQNRLTGLIGPRGTGKTTLLLQYIKNEIQNIDKCIYVSLDNMYFAKNQLLSFVDYLYEVNGVRYFFLDEIHKYPNWNQEIKNLYDSYPDIHIIFSGSSSIDLIHGSHDLSRRGVIYRLHGLSFREFLLFNDLASIEPVSFQDLIEKRTKIEESIGSVAKIRGYFKDYLEYGYYPFFTEGLEFYNQKLFRIIEKTIYEDISNYYKLKTDNLVFFRLILAYIATIPPGELNRNAISKNMRLDNKTVQSYLSIMQDTGLISLITNEKSGSSVLKGIEKIYLQNPNLYHAIIEETGFELHTGSVREIFFINMIQNSGERIFYNRIGDFKVAKYNFEIGGKGKSLKQIKESLENSFLVKDDILFGSKYEIPLYLFGFLY